MKLPQPSSPHVLSSTTPSRDAALRRCFLQAAFDADLVCRDTAFRGAKSRLGQMCHAVLEAVSNGKLDAVGEPQLGAAIQDLWQRAAALEEEALPKSPLERHFGPAEKWP